MKETLLTHISFGSLVKLLASSFFALGIALGLLGLIASFLGVKVTSNIGSTQYTGTTAGMINVFLFPLLFGFFGTFLGVLSYLPFKFFLKFTKGLKIQISTENIK